MKPALRKLLLGAGLLALPAAALAHTDVYLGIGLDGGYAPPPAVYYVPPPPPPVYYGPTVVYPAADWRWHHRHDDWRWRERRWHHHHHHRDWDD